MIDFKQENTKKLILVFWGVFAVFVLHFTLLHYALTLFPSTLPVLAVFEFTWFLWFFAGSLFTREINSGIRSTLLLAGVPVSVKIIESGAEFLNSGNILSIIKITIVFFLALSPVFFAGTLMTSIRKTKVKFNSYAFGAGAISAIVLIVAILPLMGRNSFTIYFMIPVLALNALITVIIRKKFTVFALLLLPSLIFSTVVFMRYDTINTKTNYTSIIKTNCKKAQTIKKKIAQNPEFSKNIKKIDTDLVFFSKNDRIIRIIKNLSSTNIVWIYIIFIIIAGGLLFYRKTRNSFDEIPEIYWLATLSAMIAITAQIILSYKIDVPVAFQSGKYALVHALFLAGMVTGFRKDYPFIKKPARLFLSMGIMASVLFAIPFLIRIHNILIILIPPVLGFFAGLSLYISLRFLKNLPDRKLHIISVSYLGNAIGTLFLTILVYKAFGLNHLFFVMGFAVLISSFLRFIPLFLTKQRLVPPAAKTFPWPGVSVFLGVVTVVLLIMLKIGTTEEKESLPAAGSEYKTKPFPHKIIYENGKKFIEVHTFHFKSARIKGFAAPIDVIVRFNDKGIISSVEIGKNKETPSFIKRIAKWAHKFEGTDPGLDMFGKKGVSTISGATLSTSAIKRSIAVVRKEVLEKLYKFKVNETAYAPKRHIIPSVITGILFFFVLILALSAKFLRSVPLILRLFLLVFAFYFFGIRHNLMLSLVDLGMFYKGLFPSYMPKIVLLIGITALLLTFGSLWCGFLCPFGAMQELIHTVVSIVKSLILRKKIDLKTFSSTKDPRKTNFEFLIFSYLKYLILMFTLIAFAITFNQKFLAWDPMSYFFTFKYKTLEWLILGVLAILSLIFFRPHCRFFCPVGAFLSLFNMIAPLRRFLPHRKYATCDFGVKNKRDITCIYCNRCTAPLKKKKHNQLT